jgi:hypothetical protein
VADPTARQYWQAIVWFNLPRSLTDGQRKVLYDPLHAQLEQSNTALLAHTETALRYLHQGAIAKQCDWELDLSDGLATPLTHSAYLQPVVGLLCYRARYRFSKGQDDLAIDDLGDALAVARHVANDGTVTSAMRAHRLEEQAVRIAARHLPALPASSLHRLSSRIDDLPDREPMSRLLLNEKDSNCTWLRRLVREGGTQRFRGKWIGLAIGERRELVVQATIHGPEHLLQLVDDAEALYEEAAAILAMPFDQSENATAAFEKNLSRGNPVGCLLLEDRDGQCRLSAIRRSEAEAETRLAMLKVAMAIVADGTPGLESSPDPYGGRPFDYRPSHGGFELKSRLTIEGQPLVITFGQSHSRIE